MHYNVRDHHHRSVPLLLCLAIYLNVTAVALDNMNILIGQAKSEGSPDSTATSDHNEFRDSTERNRKSLAAVVSDSAQLLSAVCRVLAYLLTAKPTGVSVPPTTQQQQLTKLRGGDE